MLLSLRKIFITTPNVDINVGLRHDKELEKIYTCKAVPINLRFSI